MINGNQCLTVDILRNKRVKLEKKEKKCLKNTRKHVCNKRVRVCLVFAEEITQKVKIYSIPIIFTLRF